MEDDKYQDDFNQRRDNASSVTDSAEESINLMTFADKVYDVFFNVLFLMIHGNNPNPILEYLTFIIEDLQLISFAFSHKLEVHLLPDWIQEILDILEYHGENFTYAKYLLIFGLSALAVIILVLNVSYIFYGCWRGQYEYIWPIRTVRTLAIVLPTVLFMPIIATLLTAADCTYGEATPHVVAFKSENIVCLKGAHLPLFILGIVLSFFFVIISWTFNLFFLENNPTLKRPIAKLHGRVDLIYCVMKTILVVLWKFGWSDGVQPNSLNALIATGYTVLISVVMCYLMLWYFPFFSPTINHIRFGLYFTSVAVNLVSFLYVLAAYLGAIDKTPTTLSLLLGLLIPSYVAGYFISKRYYEHVNGIIDDNMKAASSIGESNDRLKMLVYSRWPLVEVSCRFLVRNTDNRVKYVDLDADWEPFMAKFNRGMKEFPTHHFVTLAYGLYLNQFANAAMNDTMSTNINAKQQLTVLLHKSVKMINKCKKQHPEWDVAFQIFFMERALSQRREVDELGDGIKMDVASYADFKKKEKVATKSHEDVVKNLMNAWRLIITKNYESQQLAAYCRGAYEANVRANDAYAELIRKFPKSQNILRQYAKFLMEVGNQPYRAKMILMRADALEEEEAQISGHRRANAQAKLKDEAKLNREKALVRTDSSSAKSDGDEQHGDRKSDVSGSSATTNIELRAENLFKSIRMRLTEKANKMVQLLKINNIFIMLITIGVILVNFFVVTNVLHTEAEDLEYYHKLFDREFTTAYEFLAVRKLFKAVQTANEEEYYFYVERLKTTVESMGDINEYLLEHRNKDNAKVSAVYTTRIKNATFSYLPVMEERVNQLLTVYDYLDTLEALGLKLSELKYGDFGLNETGAEWLEKNNDFRFIMDNIEGVQEVYDEAVHAFTEEAEATAASSSIAYILTAVQLGTVLLLLFFVDYLVSSFYQRQGNSLNLFRLIPTKKVKEILNAMIEQQNGEEGAAAGGMDADTTIEESTGGFFAGINRFRLRYVVFYLLLSVLSVVFAYFNGSHIDHLGEKFAVMVAMGDTRSYSTRAAAMVNEIAVSDEETWGSEEKIREYFLHVAHVLEKQTADLLYGNKLAHPPGYGIDEFPTSIRNLYKNPGCLTNATRCAQESRYKKEYYLSKDILLNGLERLLREFTTKINQLAAEAEQEFHPDPKILHFLDEIMDFDLVDGLQRGIDLLLEESVIYADEAVTDDIIQLIVILVFVTISYFVVFAFMASELKLRNYQIAELFLYLPQDLVKSIPELANYLRTGEIDRGVIEQINAAKDKNRITGKKITGPEEEKKTAEKKTFSFFKAKQTGSHVKLDETTAKPTEKEN